MKGLKKENVLVCVKSKPPHSIGMAATSKSLNNISKKSYNIQRKRDDVDSTQRTLVAMKNKDGSKSFMVSKPKSNPIASPVAKIEKNTVSQIQSGRTTRQKSTTQVEIKVC